MPYENERAGLKAIQALAKAGVVDKFREQLVSREDRPLPELPHFETCPLGTPRAHVLAIDGSNIYEPIPGALPSTEAGVVSLGVVTIDIERFRSLGRLPESGAVNPRQLQDTEKGRTSGIILPGRNAARKDGTNPKRWFREIIAEEMEKEGFGDESYSETLDSLLSQNRTVQCPNSDDSDSGDSGCTEKSLLPKPKQENKCPRCGGPIWITDGLRVHESFGLKSAAENHARFRDAFEILTLMNILRYLAKTALGRTAIKKTAFVMDGPLAAFGTIAALANGVRDELQRIQNLLLQDHPDTGLLVMSGIKSGPFVEHVFDLDRAPEPGQRIPRNHIWLPDNDYIRSHISAGTSQNSLPWGKLTYFGRPVILKTENGQRLVLNLAQPEAEPPLTDAPRPLALADAAATADLLGIGRHQFLPLRRAHSHAAISLQIGADLIRSLS